MYELLIKADDKQYKKFSIINISGLSISTTDNSKSKKLIGERHTCVLIIKKEVVTSKQCNRFLLFLKFNFNENYGIL